MQQYANEVSHTLKTLICYDKIKIATTFLWFYVLEITFARKNVTNKRLGGHKEVIYKDQGRLPHL